MIIVKLIGTPTCRRYQRMRAIVIQRAEQLGISIQLNESGDIEHHSQINPLSLPHLYIGDELIASQNPPRGQEIERVLISRQ